MMGEPVASPTVSKFRQEVTNYGLQSLKKKSRNGEVLVQRKNLEGLEKKIRDSRGLGGLVGIGGVGGTNSKAGERVAATFFVLVANAVKRGLKMCSPVDFAWQKSQERLGQKYMGGG
jgi:hypothetical protein